MRQLIALIVLISCISAYAEATKFPCNGIECKNTANLSLEEILKLMQMPADKKADDIKIKF